MVPQAVPGSVATALCIDLHSHTENQTFPSARNILATLKCLLQYERLSKKSCE